MTTKKSDIATILQFLRDNVLNISEITRQNKLTKILDSFAGGKSEEIFVVQNSKKKDARGILVDEEFFLDLLRHKQAYEMAIESARDEIVYRTTLERKDKQATISLAEVIADNDLDLDDILETLDEMEID